ncbi:hypothetical protein [Gandjariella thermophila]|uniref:hypothetical protein n=1 Tax=Gandjariella thermophila TaxID=1931992 RepID=UPI0018645936|nr:hypothetical protein [Gandjariella thermophila]
MRPITAVRAALTAAAVTIGLAAVPGVASAQTPVPCSADDLVSAITAANASPTGDTLSLAPNCVYVLDDSSGPLPTVTAPISIFGNNATVTRSPSASAFRIFDVDTSGTLTLNHLTVSHGDATGDFGGGIRNFGTLTVVNSTVTRNTADFSGGIGTASGATTTVLFSTVAANSAGINGGGIASDGSLTVRHSVVSNNTAGEKGGGIASDGTLEISDSTVANNTASGPTGVGGGVATTGGGTTTLTNTVVRDNSATNAPGGLDNAGASTTLTDTTVTGNLPTNCVPTPVPGCPD